MQRILVYKNEKLMFSGSMPEVREWLGLKEVNEKTLYNCLNEKRDYKGYSLIADDKYSIERISTSTYVMDRRVLSNERKSVVKLEKELRTQMLNVIDILEKKDTKRTYNVMANLYLIQELAEDVGRSKLTIRQLEEKLKKD